MRWNQRKGLYLWWYFCPPKQVYLRRHWKRHSALGKGEAHISLEITHKIMEYVSICSFTVFLGMGAGGFMGFCQAKSPTRLCAICEVLSWFCRIPEEDRRALALISHTDIPAWLACCRRARAQRPCSYLTASHTETWCHWSLRFSSCSQFSGVSASVLISHPQGPVLEKAWGIWVTFAELEAVMRIFRQRGTEAYAFLSHNLHTWSGKGNDWEPRHSEHVSACPQHTHTHTKRPFSLLFLAASPL